MSFIVTGTTSTGASIQWLIPDMILKNDCNLIDGRKGSGKSSIVSGIIGRWHNEYKSSRILMLKNILWLTSEEDFDCIVKPRLMQYGIADSSIITIPYRHAKCTKPLMPFDIDKLSELIIAHNINCLVLVRFSK